MPDIAPAAGGASGRVPHSPGRALPGPMPDRSDCSSTCACACGAAASSAPARRASAARPLRPSERRWRFCAPGRAGRAALRSGQVSGRRPETDVPAGETSGGPRRPAGHRRISRSTMRPGDREDGRSHNSRLSNCWNYIEPAPDSPRHAGGTQSARAAIRRRGASAGSRQPTPTCFHGTPASCQD